jgi:hypothetical protein
MQRIVKKYIKENKISNEQIYSPDIEECIEENQYSIFKEIVKDKDFDINKDMSNGENILFFAIKKSTNSMIIDYILKHEKFNRINDKDENGDTILTYSLSRNFITFSNMILQRPDLTCVNEKNNIGDTALSIASKKSITVTIKLLQRDDLTCINEIDSDSNTVLINVLEDNNLEAVNLILDSQDFTNIEHLNLTRNSALSIACHRGYRRICEKILDKWKKLSCLTEFNCFGYTPLLYAARSRMEDIVVKIIKRDDFYVQQEFSDSESTASTEID